ncbi:MAG: hypothetical protein AB1Z98_07375 [Nannocystaceae bacterium]
MSSRMQLSPADLDRLEDGLEGLEELALDELGDDAVGQQLSEYRGLLQLSREAMPVQEVPSGLLDGVLEEARAAAANSAPAATTSWWSRTRLSLWVPTLAFAGSAALLLVMLWPGQGDEASDATVARGEPAKVAPQAADRSYDGDGRLAAAESSREDVEDALAPAEAVRGGGLAIGERSPASASPEPEQQLADEEEEEAEPLAAAKPRRSRAKTSGSSGSAVGGLPGSGLGKSLDEPKPSSPPPAPSSGAKGDKKKEAADDDADLMREVLEGDKARRAGSCGLAKMRYDKARKSGDDAVRARALAGKGLCEAAAGNSGQAKKLFDQARAANPAVDGFIQAELSGLQGAPASDPPYAAESRDVLDDVDVKE